MMILFIILIGVEFCLHVINHHAEVDLYYAFSSAFLYYTEGLSEVISA